MMKKDLFIFQLISIVFIVFLGFILHFLYDWSGTNPLIAAFSAVNESTWEHLKLLFFPTLFTIIFGYFYFGKHSNYLCVKTKGLLLGLLFIIVFFYTYTGTLGYNIVVLDIGSFIVAVIICEYYTYRNVDHSNDCNKCIAILILVILASLFIIFTFDTPQIGIFEDPITNTYGL